MGTLQFRFLGTIEISHQGRALPIPVTLKSQSLLAYLVMHRDQPHARQKLAGLYWGNKPERKARHSLATSLWHIRRCLPEDGYIQAHPHLVHFKSQCDLQIDVEDFERLIEFDDLECLLAAVEQYRGAFLDGLYHDWIISERHRLELLYINTLARLMVIHEEQGNFPAALMTATRMLTQDSLREDAHRVAMRAYTRMGQRSAALEQYHRCREILQEELGAKPMVETNDLYQVILEGSVVHPNRY